MGRPRLGVEQLRAFQLDGRPMPRVQTDLNALNMQLLAGTPSRLQIAWCALCGKDVGGDPRKLRVHEKQAHPEPGAFSCSSCKRTFSCSDDLRKHSRSTHHEIPAAFGRYLRSRLFGDDNDHEKEDSDEQLQQHREKEDVVPDAKKAKTAVADERATFIVKGASGE